MSSHSCLTLAPSTSFVLVFRCLVFRRRECHLCTLQSTLFSRWPSTYKTIVCQEERWCPYVRRSETLKGHLLQHLCNLPATAPSYLSPSAAKKGTQNLQQFTQVIWLQTDVIKQKASAQKKENVRVGHDWVTKPPPQPKSNVQNERKCLQTIYLTRD